MHLESFNSTPNIKSIYKDFNYKDKSISKISNNIVYYKHINLI